MVVTLLVPIQAYMFPLYDELRAMGLLNTTLGFIFAKVGAQVGSVSYTHLCKRHDRRTGENGQSSGKGSKGSF